MKPTFALDLTRDTIALLHRTPKGWLAIGEVAFDAPDLDEAVDYLRKTALGLSPMGMATKIILPASQILYAEINAPGPSRDEKRRQIAEGLEGRTPYAVEDLVFDWSGKGATVKVAVVARETLDEAEAFAVAHRLNPVSYVAIPEEGSFVGEAWFGPTAAAATLLAPGEKVERDRDAVVVLHRELAPPAQPSAAVAEPQAEPVAEPVAESASQAEPSDTPKAVPAESASTDSADDDTLPGLEEALNADPLQDQPADAAETVPDAQPKPKSDAPADPATVDGAVDGGADDLEKSLTAALADAEAADRAAAAPVAEVPAEIEEAPFAHVTDPTAFPDGEDGMSPAPATRRAGVTDPDLDDDIPPAPPSAAMVAFASRRAGAAPGTGNGPARPVEGAPRPSAPVSPVSPKLGAPATRAAGAKGFAGLVTAPSIPGTRAKPKLKPSLADATRPGAQIAASAAGGVKSPARPGGTFGTAAPPRSRSAVVFMVLVALLLLCLALIAAWSSFYLTRNAEETNATTEFALDSVPDVDDEMLADMQDPEGMTDPLPEASGSALAGGDAGALATESLDLTALDDEAPAIELAADAVADPPAETLIEAATDLAAMTPPETAPETAPEAPLDGAAVEPAPGTQVATSLSVAAPPTENQDEIFLSAMDAPPPALDALALPTPALVADTVPDAPMPPPAFGTVYQFDARGLLLATPEGILSPDGVFLIAGKPPLLPPSRSELAAAAALAAAAVAPATEVAPEAAPTAADASLVTAGTEPQDGAAAETAAETVAATPEAEPAPAADPAMAGFRPRARPTGLVPEAEDDASLATEPESAVATLRPLARPDIVLAAASATRPAGTASDNDVAALAPADLGAQGASLAAQAEAQLAAAAALEAQNPSIVAISMRPAARPRDLSRAVEAAVAAAVRAPEPPPEVIETAAAAPAAGLKPEELDELDEPEVAGAAPSIPTRASVAKQATFTKAINLSKLNLIGTYGTDSRRTALIRQSNGKYKKVKVGDKIDGGTIMAITEREVRYQKGGKLLALTMPKA